MLYKSGRHLMSFLLSQFFSAIKVRGDKACEEGPLLIVSNHPNNTIDPLLLVKSFRRDLWFLAKSTVFSNKVIAAFLRAAHLIPIYRPQDNPSKAVDNRKTFQQATAHLAKQHGIVIFPEGTSWGGRRMFPLKTGAARIAFQAEKEADWSLGLRIQPVGITYTDFEKYRSDVTVNFGEPILVEELRESYLADARGAVKSLTEELEKKLEDLVVTVKSEDDEKLVEKIADLYVSAGDDDDDFSRLKTVVTNVEALAPAKPEYRAELEQRLKSYFCSLRSMGLERGESLKKKDSRLFLLPLLPFVYLGALLFYIPYQLIGPLAKKFSDHPVELATNKIFVGAGVYLLWFVLLVSLSSVIFQNNYSFGLAVFSILALGYFANNFIHKVNLAFYSVSGLNSFKTLREERDALITELNSLRID